MKYWEDLCHKCGKCCYVRYRGPTGKVHVCYDRPCEYLDTKNKICRVYDKRFEKCDHCGKIYIWTALFHPTLPEDCGYVETFRFWKKENKK